MVDCVFILLLVLRGAVFRFVKYVLLFFTNNFDILRVANGSNRKHVVKVSQRTSSSAF